jgi:hypothetical protein
VITKTHKYRPDKAEIHEIFSSPEEFYNHFVSKGCKLRRPNDWGGYMPLEQVVNSLLKGTSNHVAEAEKLVSEILQGVDLSTLDRQWENSVAGAMPDIGAYLSNDPMNMRQRVFVSRDVAPIKMYIATSSSAVLKQDLLLKRGLAILSLAIALTRSRPVELYTFSCFDSGVTTIVKLPTAPLNLGILSFALVDVEYSRRFEYEYHKVSRGWGGAWHSLGFSMEACRQFLGSAEQDYVFPPIHLENVIQFQDPIKWVKAELKKLSREDG